MQIRRDINSANAPTNRKPGDMNSYRWDA